MNKISIFLVLACLTVPAWAQIKVNAGGDVNFNRDIIPARANDTHHKGQRHVWEDMTRNLGDHFRRGINFANVECVVSDKNLTKYKKTWNFLSHPNSIEHLIDVGFNLFSVANNHTYDYKLEGIQETHKNMSELSDRFSKMNWHGVGTLSETTKPREFYHNGIKIAFSAIGIFSPSSYYSKDNEVGALGYRNASHYNAVLKGLKESDAAFKILSIHQGAEGVTSITKQEINTFRRAVDEAGVNFVIGHHPHVVRPIEIYNGSLIAYSLGNLLLVGAANNNGARLGKDYGLVLNTKFRWNSRLDKYTPDYIKAIPLKNVHIAPREVDNKSRIKYTQNLNSLNKRTFGSSAVQFGFNKRTKEAIYRD